MRVSARITFCSIPVLLLLAGASSASAADEGAADAKALLADIAKARKDPERAGLPAALERVPDVHNGLEDAALKKKLQKVVGQVLRDKDGGANRSAAAAVLGRLNDPAGAFAELSKALPGPKDKEVTPSQLEALRSVAALAPEAAIAPLLKLLQKGKAMAAVTEAVHTLGAFGKSKKRELILKDMLEAMSRHRAAAQAAEKKAKAKKPKKDAGEWAWKALEGPLVESANKLTGQQYANGEAWLDAYSANKKKLGALFAPTTD